MIDIKKYVESNRIGTIFDDVELSKHTTYKTGGVCSYFVEPSTYENVLKLISFLRENSINFFVIGNGSNIILPDGYHNIVVIKLSNLSDYTVGDGYIEVDAGLLMPKIALELAYENISCFEFASGIPGTLGGCIYMNAGAYGTEIKDVLISATLLNYETNEIFEISVEELNFSYRHSILMEKPWIVLKAKFKYTTVEKEDIVKLINKRRNRRVETQPIGQASAGSVFRNFEKVGAWEMIEKSGLRGYCVGDACISDKHCNMIINIGNATSTNIIDLITYIKKVVFEKTGEELVLEQKIIVWD